VPVQARRFEAAGACGELGAEEAVPFLIKLTRDDDADVQQTGYYGSWKIGGNKRLNSIC